MLVPSVLKKFTAFTDSKARACFSAINFKRNGTDCTAVASDGRKMIQVDWESDSPVPFGVYPGDSSYEAMVSVGSFNNAVKIADAAIKDHSLFMRKANAFLPYTLCERAQELAPKGDVIGKAPLETVDATFPSCNGVWPDTYGATTIRVNAQYLKDLCDAVIALHGADKSSPTITLTVRDGQSALLGTAVKNLGGTSKISLKSVIMPLAND